MWKKQRIESLTIVSFMLVTVMVRYWIVRVVVGPTISVGTFVATVRVVAIVRTVRITALP